MSCQSTWNTTDGGPCFFRPTNSLHSDNPMYKTVGTKYRAVQDCVENDKNYPNNWGLGRRVKAFFEIPKRSTQKENSLYTLSEIKIHIVCDFIG